MEQQLGYYIVDGKHFHSKSHAVYEASVTGKKLEWYFNNEVWDYFSKNKLHTLGNTTLDDLYKKRAQQLRDKYDYLILNYSGGPDSHNVLMTFINNGIHLDEVYVKYSHSVESKVYTPNTTVTGAENIFSEWDYCIKPTLEWLAIAYPNIKIVVDDVFNVDLDKTLDDDTFILNGHYLGAFEITRQRKFSDSIITESEKNKRVCEIYGIDKPMIFSEGNEFFLYFVDNAVSAVARHTKNRLFVDNLTELFYWTPDMPEIVFEQAYKLMKHLRARQEYQNLHDRSTFTPLDINRIEQSRRVTIPVIYSTWDMNKFQADKPIPLNEAGRTRDMYLLSHPEFSKYISNWHGRFTEWKNTIADHLLIHNATQTTHMVSKRYKIGEMK